MTGSPEHTANASLYYEKDGLNARLSYNFASDFVDEFGTVAALDRYYDKVNYLDLNVGYTFGRKFKTTFYAEAGNLLNRHDNVAFYVCGHIHNFQHLRPQGSKTDYVVNSSASLSRKVAAVEGTVFCSPESGFSVIAADRKELCLYMIDKSGRVLHTVRRTK